MIFFWVDGLGGDIGGPFEVLYILFDYLVVIFGQQLS